MNTVMVVSFISLLWFIYSVNGLPLTFPQLKLNLVVEEEKSNEKSVTVPKKILNRSIFVVPTVKPTCSKGFMLNYRGNCDELVDIDNGSYFRFIMDKIFGYDYDDNESNRFSGAEENNSRMGSDESDFKRLSIPLFGIS